MLTENPWEANLFLVPAFNLAYAGVRAWGACALRV